MYRLEATADRTESLVEELKRSNDQLAEFAHVASHDLQAPITMITSFLKLLEERHADRLDDEGREFIAFALEGTDRMQALVSGLLSYARVGSQRAPTAVPLTEIVDEAVTDLHVVVVETGAEIEVAPLPTVRVDRNQMRQLFQNLISNALKFRSSERPKIEIAAETVGEAWIVAVGDNGIGIDPSSAQRVFAPFERLHGVSEYSGSGIGLAVCKRIVENHGGRIWVEPRRHGGSVFLFSLPATQVIRLEEAPEETA